MSTRYTHTRQQNASDLQVSPPTEAAKRPLEEQMSHQRWICPGCGTTHMVMLPEECQSCGAIWLEFEYASHDIEELHH
jgi:rubrerythrin